MVCSPKSRASLWNLRGFDDQFAAARDRALPVLEKFMEESAKRSSQQQVLIL